METYYNGKNSSMINYLHILTFLFHKNQRLIHNNITEPYIKLFFRPQPLSGLSGPSSRRWSRGRVFGTLERAKVRRHRGVRTHAQVPTQRTDETICVLVLVGILSDGLRECRRACAASVVNYPADGLNGGGYSDDQKHPSTAVAGGTQRTVK